MEYFRVTTTGYEKYLGMKNGVEYGWSLTYPVISGLADKNVQSKINSAIESFFLQGPSFPAQREALSGSYGLAVKGRLRSSGQTASAGPVWALRSGTTISRWTSPPASRHPIIRDLFQRDYLECCHRVSARKCALLSVLLSAYHG